MTCRGPEAGSTVAPAGFRPTSTSRSLFLRKSDQRGLALCFDSATVGNLDRDYCLIASIAYSCHCLLPRLHRLLIGAIFASIFFAFS